MIIITHTIGDDVKRELQTDLDMFGDTNCDDFDKAMDEYTKIKEDREEVVTEEFEITKEGVIKYVKPVCIYCDSTKVNCDGKYGRDKEGLFGRKIKIVEQKYVCKECGRKFKAEGHGIIDKYKHKVNEVLDFPKKLRQIAHISLRHTSEIMDDLLNSRISPSHLVNLYNTTKTNSIFNIWKLSGFFTYDEQYIKIFGVRFYRLLLFDDVFNFPVAERIVRYKSKKNIINFIKDATEGENFFVLTTDLATSYPDIAKKLGVKHNLCIFHTKKYIYDIVDGAVPSKLSKFERKQKIDRIVAPLFKALDMDSVDEARAKINSYLMNDHRIPKKLLKFINGRLLPELDSFMMHTTDDRIPKTSNHAETYFSVTLAKIMKKLFKTIPGIVSYLKVQMEKWTENHGKTYLTDIKETIIEL